MNAPGARRQGGAWATELPGRTRDWAAALPGRVRAAARRPENIALTVIVLVGLVMRLYLLSRWQPAFVGFPDSAIYLRSAHTGLYQNPLHVAGYAEFLRLMHWLRPHLLFAIRVQHLLGLASGVLLFAAMRRAGFPRGLGLFPAAVVILGGSEILLEHAVLTEALFIFLIALALYALVRWWTGSPAWAALCGLAMGCAVTVRSIGEILLVVFVLMALLAARGAWRRRVLGTALMVLLAAIPIGLYLRAHKEADGYGGFTGAGYIDLYARVAPFADCHKFHPPAGTRKLCIDIPPSQRPGHAAWDFLPISPAYRAYGEPDEAIPKRDENAQLRAFAEAAILGQPLEYLEAVGREIVRLVDTSYPSSRYGNSGVTGTYWGTTPQQLVEYFYTPSTERIADEWIAGYYTDGISHHSFSPLLTWERDTRVEGPFMALLMLLALLAPILAPAPQRRATLLFFLTALVLLLAPIFLSEYDYRFAIPAFGPLAASAAIGAWALVTRSRALLERRRRGRGGGWDPAVSAGQGP
ncbi:MAG: ArnT family glycosyltransferase [Solirubrobacteraceae bacterium]